MRYTVPMECVSCSDQKAKLKCKLCHATICKSCAQFMEDDAFLFLDPKPAELAHDTYCPGCYDRVVATPLANYEIDLERARALPIYLKRQSRETKWLDRKADPLTVVDWPDHDQAILKLAYMALKSGYNGMVNVTMLSTKIRPGNYQTTIWTGQGTPVHMDESRMVKDRSFWDNPS